MTVTEFKRLVQAWPEHNEDGTETEVWVESAGRWLSDKVKSVQRLNENDLFLMWSVEDKETE